MERCRKAGAERGKKGAGRRKRGVAHQKDTGRKRKRAFGEKTKFRVITLASEESKIGLGAQKKGWG